jgi:hypothetical protein
MWKLVNCYLSGRHEFDVRCEPGAIFLICAHCGKRSSGWAVQAQPRATAPRRAATPVGVRADGPRLLPFDRVAARGARS